MASKILMDDMPELMENIVKNLNNEIYSLYSCALVSRHWCKISIPILWQDPFSFSRRSPLFISNYFSSLGEYEKIILKECGINEEFSKTIFDYARFLKDLDLSRLYFQVEKWIELVLDNSNSLSDNRLKHNRIIDITNLLLKLLIENGATLHSLDLFFSKCREFKPEIFYVLGQNVQFLSQLQYLSLNEIDVDDIDSATTWLRAVAKYTTKISTLEIELFYPNYRFFTEFYGMISSLESQKNSLQEVIIDTRAFNEEFEVLKICKNLEVLRIRSCDQELSKLSKILDNKIGNKISTRDVICSQIYAQQPIALMLEKSGTLLQRLRLKLNGDESQEYTLLLEALKSFCPNIIYLDIMNIKFSTQLVELISELQKLRFLSLRCYNNDIPDEELKKQVMQFSEILPLTLQYLDLNTCTDRILHTKQTFKNVGVYEYIDLDDNIRKEVEAYVELVTFRRILVYC
ncbi:hypothetical protein C2G38_2179334 [Gigaspora rosea]|uniref:F-box domain-containing protein n=1 Tax=Gigaspora rosea TaxID=44941 RepID=A0A397VDB3_9GLOM|nr:hypothetical protein C2G38_2179334 [Gigaspora rosea]